MFRKSAIICLAPLLVLIPSMIPAQMPDWKFFRDREGNSYYYDRAYKIRIPETEGVDYIPVSSEGIDFYLNTGIELINESRYSDGLFYLKSIRMLPDDNSRVQKAKTEAVKWITYLSKKHGTRFGIYDNEAAVLIIKANGGYRIVNEKLYYQLFFPYRPYLLKKTWKYYDRGYGLKIGAKIDEKGSYEGFDYIAGVESRIFKGAIGSVDEALSSWMVEIGRDAFERKEIFRRDDRIINEIKYPGGAPFSGIEGVYKNGNMSHMARIVYHDSVKGEVYSVANKILEGLILVNHP